MNSTISYLVKWEIDIEANSPEEAARLALEIQRDNKSEAVAFTVKRQSTGEETDVDLLDSWDESKGSDICYGCGKAQEYQTMRDVKEDDFAIYCDSCLGKAKVIQELKELREQLEINQSVDFVENDPSDEFKIMENKVKKIIEDLVISK